MTTVGPSLVTSGTNQGTGVSWTNPGNITAADSTAATLSASIKNGNPSKLLTGTNVPFSIDAAATINGVTMTVSAKDTSNLARIFQAFLTKDGTTSVGTNQASTTALTTAFATYTIGGASNLWGTTLTPSDVNSINFGGMIQFDTSNTFVSSSGVQVDWMKITVDYTLSGTNYSVSATISGASAVSGGLVVNYGLNSAISGASSLSGSVALSMPLVGSISNTSSVAGTLTRNFSLAATISVASSIVGALGNNQAIAGTISAASDVTGTILRNFSLSAILSAITDIAASMVVDYGGAANVSNTSNVSADMGIDRGLVGTVSNQTNVSGTLTVQKAAGTLAPGMLGDSNVCDLSP